MKNQAWLWERVKRRLGIRSAAEYEILASGVVDREWYLELYPDVRSAGIDAALHFALYGFREGRQPNPFFTGRWYDDVETNGSTDGTASPPDASLEDEIGRSGIVDREWYLERYPDVAAAAEDPVRHFAQRGIRENRRPNAFFSPSWYLAKHPEVAASGLDPVLHYIRLGSPEGLDPHPLFNRELYLRGRTDIPRQDPLAHFLGSRGNGAPSTPFRFPAPPVPIERYPAVVQNRIRNSPILTRVPAIHYLAPSLQPDGAPDDGPRSMEEFIARSHDHRYQIGPSLRRTDLDIIIEMERRKRRLAAEYSARRQEELVSVIMPTYNRQDTIADAINSIIVQTYRNWELIVVEDGPDTGTEALVSAYGDSRIRFIRHDSRRGMAAARNTGLKHCTGAAIVHLDDDDQYDPDFLLISLNAMRDRGKRMIYCGLMIWDGFDELTLCGANFAGVLYRDFDRNKLEQANYLSMSVVMHDRGLADTIGGFDETLTRLIDWDFFLRMTEAETPVRIPAIMHHYFRQRTPNSMSADSPAEINIAWIKAKLEARRSLSG